MLPWCSDLRADFFFGFLTESHYSRARKSLFSWEAARKHSRLKMGSLGFTLAEAHAHYKHLYMLTQADTNTFENKGLVCWGNTAATGQRTHIHKHKYVHMYTCVYSHLSSRQHPLIHPRVRADRHKCTQLKMHREEKTREAKGPPAIKNKEWALERAREKAAVWYHTGTPVAWQGREMNLECSYT